MSRLSLPAVFTAVVFAVSGVFAKGRFLEIEGPMAYAVDAGAGALSPLVGAVIGMILFPKKGDEND